MNFSTLQENSSRVLRDVFGFQYLAYSKTTSVLLTVLYVLVFILSLIGNFTALVVLIKTSWQKNRMRTAYIINLVLADISGMSCCVLRNSGNSRNRILLLLFHVEHSYDILIKCLVFNKCPKCKIVDTTHTSLQKRFVDTLIGFLYQLDSGSV